MIAPLVPLVLIEVTLARFDLGIAVGGARRPARRGGRPRITVVENRGRLPERGGMRPIV